MEKVCETKDIPAGSMRGYTVKGRKILLANVGGNFHAMDAVCSHMQGYLPGGRLEGKTVTCPVHSSQYDVTTGRVVRNVSWAVKTFTRKSATDLATFKTEVKDGSVYVEV
ncbi:MAG: Rieske 2Fe-2S domain-containing protein [Methanomicrobiales archaeon]|nr:Rieske 2Fe-2S domain-containing protein [Methanomicrobiales archaeon]